MRFRPVILVFVCAALSGGCASKDVPEERTADAVVFTQDMSPYSGTDNPENVPGLEGMPDDGQGVIYF